MHLSVYIYKRLTQENRKLRQHHTSFGEQVAMLMDISLLRQEVRRLYIHLYLYLYLSIGLSVYLSMCIYNIHVYICVYIHRWMNTYMYMHTYIYIRIYIYTYIYTCIYEIYFVGLTFRVNPRNRTIPASANRSPCSWTSCSCARRSEWYMYMYMYICNFCLSLSICLFVCMYVFICLFSSFGEQVAMLMDISLLRQEVRRIYRVNPKDISI